MKLRKTPKQSQYDKMTGTPVPRLILGLSVPTIISMLVTNIYNLVDTAFVGQLGTSASGAVGIVFGFMSVIQAVGFLYGQGAGSILSRALGQRDRERASLHATAGFLSSFTTGLIVGVLGLIFLDPIVHVLGSTDTIAPYAKTYLTYILVAAPFMCSCLTLNNLLRYEGKASLGMIGLMVGAVLNMAGDPILMFGLNMGIAGAGLSTALSQFISFLVLIYTAFLDPEMIVLGGGVSHAGQFLLDSVEEKLPRFLMYKTLPSPRLTLAQLGNEAGIIGAALLGRE